jgi:hypothetical protein
MENSSMKSVLIHADRQTYKHKAKWCLCNYTNAHENSCDSQIVRRTTQHFSCAWIREVKKKILFCYLTIAVLKDVCTCQLHVILSHRCHGLHFVQTVQWPPTEISQQQLNLLLWPYVFLISIFSVIVSANGKGTVRSNSYMYIGSS